MTIKLQNVAASSQIFGISETSRQTATFNIPAHSITAPTGNNQIRSFPLSLPDAKALTTYMVHFPAFASGRWFALSNTYTPFAAGYVVICWLERTANQIILKVQTQNNLNNATVNVPAFDIEVKVAFYSYPWTS